ncbi:hypothetical protein I312_103095 [Cryptococcus bacillisporus CA1280]|uniref:uncharacterized protein n=1 Tax=Cryptococcus bacillisporus CA1280 TaxID=1296109 RepID=UPI0033667319
MTSVVPPQSNIPNARTKPSRTPSVPAQPASTVKSAFTLSRRPAVRQPIQPILAQPIPQPSQAKQIPTSSRYPFPTQPSKKPPHPQTPCSYRLRLIQLRMQNVKLTSLV